MITILLGLVIRFSKPNDQIVDDEIALNKAKQELDNDNYDYYEIESVESVDKNTTVIANTRFLEIAIELDSKTGKILNKEKIAREST